MESHIPTDLFPSHVFSGRIYVGCKVRNMGNNRTTLSCSCFPPSWRCLILTDNHGLGEQLSWWLILSSTVAWTSGCSSGRADRFPSGGRLSKNTSGLCDSTLTLDKSCSIPACRPFLSSPSALDRKIRPVANTRGSPPRSSKYSNESRFFWWGETCQSQ